MSKVLKDLSALGIEPGTKVNGLFSQTLNSVYESMFEEEETVTFVGPYPDDEDMVIVKTKELTAKTHMYTSEGEVELAEEDKQYVISGVHLIKVIDKKIKLDSVSATDDDGAAVKFTKSDAGIDTEFSTFTPGLLTSLTPFINYVNANADELDDLLDVSSLAITADGVTYNIDTLSALSKIIDVD